jgi:hypothetical protein
MNPFNNIMKQPKGLDFSTIFSNPRIQQTGPTSSVSQAPISGQGGDIGLGYPSAAVAPPQLPPVMPMPQQMENPYADLLSKIKGTNSKPGVNPWFQLIQGGRG